MAAVFGMWATIAIMVVVGVDATAFVVSSSSRSASTNTQLASEYASTRARTQNDYNIDINRELGGPMVSYNGPNTRPVSNIRAPSLGEIWDSTMPVTVLWMLTRLIHMLVQPLESDYSTNRYFSYVYYTLIDLSWYTTLTVHTSKV